jgi:hypothetical protein
MRPRIQSTSNAARRFVLGLALSSLPALVLVPACSSHETKYGPPTGGPPNGTISSGTGGGTPVEAGPGFEPCGCAVTLDEKPCLDCALDKIAAGHPCQVVEDACKADLDCTADAACVGACLHVDAGSPDPACVHDCLKVATAKYGAYLACICQTCHNECSSPVTCPADSTTDGGTGGTGGTGTGGTGTGGGDGG